MNEAIEILCPYCGQPVGVAVDLGGGREQQFVSDCEVCCRPIEFTITVDEDGRVDVATRASGE